MSVIPSLPMDLSLQESNKLKGTRACWHLSDIKPYILKYVSSGRELG